MTGGREIAEVVEFPAPDASGFVLTPTAEAVISHLDYCQRYGELGLIVGNPGVGKTSAINHYARSNEHVTVVEMPHLPNRAFGPALDAVCEGLSYKLYSRDYTCERATSLRKFLDRFWDGLDKHRPLIVIDEAQNLPKNMIDNLRSCWDSAQIGMVLNGNSDLRRRFQRFKYSSLAPFDSRAGMRLDLVEPNLGDVSAICHARAVQGAREATYLHQYAKTGGLRRIAKIIDAAERHYPGESIRLPHLESAVLFLGL